MKTTQKKTIKRMRLKAKIRSQVHGTQEVPRLSVFRSNIYIYAQLINDDSGVTLASASDLKVKKGTKVERAQEVGRMIADAAKAKSITKVVFDRNGFKYTGRIKALADKAREQGLTF